MNSSAPARSKPARVATGRWTKLLFAMLTSLIRAYRGLDTMLARCGRWARPHRRDHAIRHFLSTDSGDAEPDGTIGPLLSRDDAPDLFRELVAIARRAGGAYPSEVRLSFLPACGVLDLGVHGGYPRQVLIIGMPCFQILTRSELRSVLAHELTHLLLEDASFTRDVLNFLYGLQRAAPVDSGVREWLHPRRLLAHHVSRAFLAVASPLSRKMEFRADRWAAEQFGPEPLATALEKIAVVQPIFREVLVMFDPLEQPNDNVYEFFERAWSRLLPEQYQSLLGRLLDSGPVNDGDPHPPIAERLQRLQRIADTRDPEGGRSSSLKQAMDAEPALKLLAEPEEWKVVLHNHLYGHHQKSSSVFQKFETA